MYRDFTALFSGMPNGQCDIKQLAHQKVDMIPYTNGE